HFFTADSTTLRTALNPSSPNSASTSVRSSGHCSFIRRPYSSPARTQSTTCASQQAWEIKNYHAYLSNFCLHAIGELVLACVTPRHRETPAMEPDWQKCLFGSS